MERAEEFELIEKAKSGDKHALEKLVEEFAPMVFRFSFNVCRNQEKAEHTTQETFLSVLKKLHQFDNRSKFSTWLYTIVSNHCFMLARKEKANRFVSLDEEESVMPEKTITPWEESPLSRVEQGEIRRLLDEGIERLSPDYRIVFVLRDIEGLSTNEISKITNLSVPAVKSRLHRARAFLRNFLTPYFAEEFHD